MKDSTERDPPCSSATTVVDELFRLPRYASRPGLHRMERLLAGTPEARPAPAIHVVGSNGKGSVSSWIAAWLSALGFRVGLFTSPHLRRVNERFRIGGEPVTDEEIVEAVAWLRPRLAAGPADDPVLAFEALSAVAARIFYRAAVDVVVWEAGIGGRHDATRIFGGLLAALVSVDLEHTSVLGDTLEAIALDKAEIVAEGGTLVLGDLPASVARRVASAAQPRGVRLSAIRPEWRSSPLLGTGAAPYLEHNAALAASTVDTFLEMSILTSGRTPSPSPSRRESAEKAFAACPLPGRMERAAASGPESPEVWVDMAHTPDATAQVAKACAQLAPGKRWTIVLGISADKIEKTVALVAPLAEPADLFVCTRAAHRGGDPTRIETRLAAFGKPVIRRDEPAAALAEARSHGRPILVTGSLFLAVEVGEILAGRDPRALSFY